MKIILIGMMGSGKSTIGKRLASELDANFLDMDEIIEHHENKAITKIFEESGESYFRALEHLVAKEIEHKDGVVIATGGGVVINPDTMLALKHQALVVYLYIPVASIVKRLKGDRTRPLLQNTALDEKLNQVYSERKSLYESNADLIVNVDKKSIETVVTEVIEKYKML